MTVQDICSVTKMSQSTVYDWIKNGLAIEKRQGVSRVRLSELTRFIGTLGKDYTPPPSVVPSYMKKCSKCQGSVCDRCEMCEGACKCGSC